MSRPPARSFFSNTVTLCPARFSCWAQARPAGPPPITATFLPLRTGGTSGLIQPMAKPLSTIDTSCSLIVTGGSLMPSTHEFSHGAGQTRPVNSGKLLVACSAVSASCQRPR